MFYDKSSRYTRTSFPQDANRYQAEAKPIIQLSSHDESQVPDQFFSDRVCPGQRNKKREYCINVVYRVVSMKVLRIIGWHLLVFGEGIFFYELPQCPSSYSRFLWDRRKKLKQCL